MAATSGGSGISRSKTGPTGLAAVAVVVALAVPAAPAVAAESESSWRTNPHGAVAAAATANSKQRNTLTLRGPREVTDGAAVQLRGKLRGAKGQRVRVKIQLLGSTGWQPIANTRTKSRGKFRSSVTVAATDRATLRAVAKAQRRKQRAVSKRVTVAFTQSSAPASSPAPAPQPATSPDPADSASPTPDSAMTERELRMVTLVNEARAAGHSCGQYGYFPPAPPLEPQDLLAAAAQAHSDDMVANDFFSHTGSNGSAPWDRMSEQGYRWSRAGENIAAGYSDAAAATRGLLDSPGHCRNIMDPEFTEIGVGLATGSSGYGSYWTQNFGTPRG